jgi:hypothetical protein
MLKYGSWGFANEICPVGLPALFADNFFLVIYNT